MSCTPPRTRIMPHGSVGPTPRGPLLHAHAHTHATHTHTHTHHGPVKRACTNAHMHTMPCAQKRCTFACVRAPTTQHRQQQQRLRIRGNAMHLKQQLRRVGNRVRHARAGGVGGPGELTIHAHVDHTEQRDGPAHTHTHTHTHNVICNHACEHARTHVHNTRARTQINLIITPHVNTSYSRH